jgi:hypothetical protein
MHMKETLSPVRVLHFLSATLLFATYIRPNSSILRSFAAKAFVIAGQRSLEMFSVSVILSMATNFYVLAESPSLPVRLILDCTMAAAMTLVALIIARSDRTRSAHRRQSSQIGTSR